jgi:hypothetical protein
MHPLITSTSPKNKFNNIVFRFINPLLSGLKPGSQYGAKTRIVPTPISGGFLAKYANLREGRPLIEPFYILL